MPSGQARRRPARTIVLRWFTAASKPSVSVSQRHLSSVPAMPTTRRPRIFPIWPTSDPTAPAAAETTSVSPGFGRPISKRPTHAVSPMWPRSPRCASSGRPTSGSRASDFAFVTA